MKRLFFGISLAMAMSLISLPINATEVDDITKEVLKGPSDLDPSKILGPGGVGIETSKGLLMSFGATVRMIPTFESNWDFGMSDNVDGFFNVEPLKTFANTAFNTASTGNEIYSSSAALNNAISNDRGIRSAFDDYANSLYSANSVLGDLVKPAADGAAQVQSAANAAATVATANTATVYMTGIEAGTAASNAYSAAIAAQDMTIAGEALVAIATDPDYQAAVAAGDAAAAQARATAIATPYVTDAAYAGADAQGAAEGTALRAVFADPNYQAAMAAGNTEAAQAAAQGVLIAAAGDAGDAAASGIIKDMSAPIIAGTEGAVATLAQKLTKDPNAEASNIIDAFATTSAANAKAQAFSPYLAMKTLFKTHINESGYVNDSYIRTEVKMYFNAMPRNKKWSFYAALEYDRPIDTASIDHRGGKGVDGADSGDSNFGLERLNASIELVPGLRFHGGWDIWSLDAIEAASMVYGDDNAGFWLNGDYGKNAFSIGWFKLEENDYQRALLAHNSENDNDRDIFAAYYDYRFDGTEKNKLRLFYALDRIRDVPSLDMAGYFASSAGYGDYAGIYGNNGIIDTTATSPDVDSHIAGGYWLGEFGAVQLMLEGAYKFGSADGTGLKGVTNGTDKNNDGIMDVIQYDDFDISSYAFAADLAFELKSMLGWKEPEQSFKPHMGIMYTTGDDDSEDDKLSGYTGAQSGQRYSRIWGGENTIIGDTNFVLGTSLYSYIPGFYGNGTPVFVGGLHNFDGYGHGRGDNPGLTMYSFGLTLRPKIFLIYRTNVNVFHWNEDFYVGNMLNPIRITESGLSKSPYTMVESGHAGTEWDNEITLGLSKHMFLKFYGSFFFPGDAVKKVTAVLSDGTESDEVASRIGGELIWNF
ncbi:MAG: hypothetical protein GY749_15735 [Desulfobacteraceae bacterium]|nr:hypothetical protein [Desulfobacteraceae bacterium]